MKLFFRTAGLIGAILLAGLPASAQASASYRIAGRVVNSVSGDPVRHAAVTVLSQEQNHVVASVLTDGEGRFSVPGLASGKYPLSASRRGFRTAYYDEHEGFNTAIVTGPDQDTEHLVFQLAPGAVIFGAVTGDGGDPEENANVVLFRRDPTAPGRRPQQFQSASTDDTGAYEFTDLPAGEYFVAVGTHPWWAMHGPDGEAQAGENNLDVAYPVTFFDSTTDEASASPIAVTAGSRVEANISLHAVPALRIRLTGPRQANAGPGIDIRQTVFGAEFPAQADIQGSQNGTWEVVGLPPGHYDLSTTNPARATELDATASMDLDPTSGVPSQPVQGLVHIIDGSSPADINLSLMPGGPGAWSMNFRVEASVHNSHFQFDAVPPGQWTLEAHDPSGNSLNAFVAVTGGPATGPEITVRDQPLAMTVTLSRTRTRIDGFARNDGKAAPGVMIVLVPRDPKAYPSLVRRDQSDSDGSFSLPDVPPGRYNVIAIQDGWNLDWQDRALIARYLPGGQPVTIGTQAGSVIHLAQPVEAVLP